MTKQPTAVVAVVNDEPVADPVVQRATELGFGRGARVALRRRSDCLPARIAAADGVRQYG